MSRVSLLTFLLFAAFVGGLGRPNLATTDGRTSNNADSAIIEYWQTMLPHSTMPPAIRDLLTPNNAEADGGNTYLPVSAFHGKEANPTVFHEKRTNVDNTYLPVSSSYGKEAENLNPTIPVSAFYEKEVKNLNPRIFYQKRTNVDNTYLPVSAFYDKEANGLNPTIFHRKEANVDNTYLPVSTFYDKELKKLNPTIPISAFYEKEVKNLNPTIFYEKGSNMDDTYLPVSAFYGKEVKNLNPTIFNGKRINVDIPVSAFYGKEADNQNPAIFHGKGTNVDIPVSAFYGKGTNVDIPVSAFYGKETNVDIPVSAFYGKGTNVDIPVSAFYGKGINVDIPVSTSYGKGTNVDIPVSAFYGKGTNVDIPVSTSYEKEIDVDIPVSDFYDKGRNVDIPVSAFYDKGRNVDIPFWAFYGKRTNQPIQTDMADADHHVHEHHHHIDGGHEHLGSRSIGFLFLEDVLTPGSKVAPYIDPASSRGAPLLPRDVADSIPMSRKSFTDILRLFAPVSRAMAEGIWRSLDLCENPRPIKGEKRGCVTSIESMVDFAASTLGTGNLRAFSSPSVPVEGRTGSKVYTVLAARAITSPGDTMTCHAIPFPYKVFLCHALVPTKVYSVTVESDGGGVEKEKIEEALVVCHLNTAEFDPTRMPPHVKPGDAPVCHFLNNDDVLWAPAATTLGSAQGAADDVVAAQ